MAKPSDTPGRPERDSAAERPNETAADRFRQETLETRLGQHGNRSTQNPAELTLASPYDPSTARDGRAGEFSKRTDLDQLAEFQKLVNEADQIRAVLNGDSKFKTSGHLSPESIKRIAAMLGQEKDVKGLEQQINQVLPGPYKLSLGRVSTLSALNGHPGYQDTIQTYDDRNKQTVETHVISH